MKSLNLLVASAIFGMFTAGAFAEGDKGGVKTEKPKHEAPAKVEVKGTVSVAKSDKGEDVVTIKTAEGVAYTVKGEVKDLVAKNGQEVTVNGFVKDVKGAKTLMIPGAKKAHKPAKKEGEVKPAGDVAK